MAREDDRLKFNATNPGAARSWDIYNRLVKPTLKREDDWMFVVIDIDSEDYELDKNALVANDRIRLRRPEGNFWVERVGELATFRHGWRGDDHESPP